MLGAAAPIGYRHRRDGVSQSCLGPPGEATSRPSQRLDGTGCSPARANDSSVVANSRSIKHHRRAAPPPGPPGVVLCNPPYGERLGDEAELGALYRALGDTLKRRFTGYRAFVYTASLPLAKQIGLRPSARHVVFNGPLEGRLLRFDLY